MALSITIAGVARTARVRYRTLKVSKILNVETCSFDVYDPVRTAAALRPKNGESVLIYHDADLLFGGTIVKVGDSRPAPPNGGGALTRVTVVGYDKLFDSRRITKTFAAGQTSRAVAEAIRSQFLSLKGVTNIGDTTGGPTLPEMVFDNQTPRAALDAISALSGDVWRVNGAKQFAIGAAGSLPAPVTINDTTSVVVGGMDWERSALRKNNVLWLKTGSAPKDPVTGDPAAMPITWQEAWTGNGSKTVFYLAVRPDVVPTTVVQNGVSATVGAGVWSYDAVDNALVRSTAATAGHVITCDISVTLPAWVREMDQSILLTNGSYDPAIIEEDAIGGDGVTSIPQAINALSAELSIQTDSDRRKIVVKTRQKGFYPLQSVAVSFANRDSVSVTGTYLVHTVEITDEGVNQATANELFYTLTLYEGVTWFPSWIDLWRRRSGGTSNGGTSVGSGGVGGGASGTAGLVGTFPLMSYRDAGVMSATRIALGTTVWLNGSMVPAGATVQFRPMTRTDNSSTTVTAYLRRLTGTPADVATSSANGSTAWVEQTLSFTPIAGWHSYELQVVGSNANYSIYAIGAIDVLT